ncbi:MAG: TIGR00730 family Rossman fold protein [Weeksellaceae bacterium]|nr:TIGR00730 family Rossman fold protein [Weeksellaceae bacterium]
MGNQSIYGEEAFKLGEILTENKIQVVYGGAKIGVMGKLAEGVLSKNGKIIGIIPEFLKKKEIAHTGLTEIITVQTMHERKALMQEKSDGFIALPGGFGTMEELFEILTWAQLDLHRKPIGILNTNGYYNALIQFVETMIQEGLLKEEYRKMLLISDSIANLLEQMKAYEAPFISKLEGRKVM